MKNWSTKRRVSFAVHTGFVLVPFIASTASSLLFWSEMFRSLYLAAVMVAVVDVLALTGLVLYIGRIASPFVWLRHLLPFISIAPLGYELYRLLAHNGAYVAVGLTALVTGIFVYIARQCFRTIEQLFVSPIEAARERAHEQIGRLQTELAALHEKNDVVNGFVLGWIERHGVRPVSVYAVNDTPVQSVAPPQLTEDTGVQLQAYTCQRCKALNEAPVGKDATKVQAVSARHGCPQCKESAKEVV